MPYPNHHLLLRCIGHFGSSGTDVQENWSTGFRFAVIGASPPWNAGNALTFANACRAACAVFHAVTGVGAGANTYFDECTVARVGLDGKYDPPTIDTVHTGGTPVAGAGSATLPWNTAHVISLRTQKPRGYASNGRFYWPACAMTPAVNTGRLSSGNVATRLAAAKTMIDAFNTASVVYHPNTKLAVISSVGAGEAQLVTTIRADQRLDSIERRESKGPAVWSTAALA